jgi:non-specific serine/threonine protein kinase
LETEERRPSEQIVSRLAGIFEISHADWTTFLQFARGNLKSIHGKKNIDAPWNRPASSAPTNLPASSTALVGREREIARILDYLKKPEIRLITLIGPPGIGKTRLSLECSRVSVQEFKDGVFFVPLAPLDDASLIASTIIQVVGYVERGERTSQEILKTGISDRQILLILDNCEHVIDGVASLVSELLSACPHIKILATSRESMRVPGEWLYPVPGLDMPPERVLTNVQKAGQFPALALFAERARAVLPEFALNENNLKFVASICNQLDGLPLAIELIASRMRLMSPKELAERMSNQFLLSADGMRSVPERQKTLGNAIGWSYNQLSFEEQKMFVCLSVFSGSFSLNAAESIFATMFTGRPVTELIASLSDKSLLLRSSSHGGETRMSMLYTIQQFALEHLRQIGDEDRIRDAHLEYFVQYAEIARKEIRGSRQVEWLERIENEHNNNRAAMEWAISSQKTEAALRLFCALGWPWEVRGYNNEAYAWLNKIRNLPDILQYPLLYSQALNHIGRYSLWDQANFQTGYSLLEVSEKISFGLGEAGEINLAETSNWLGLLKLFNDEKGSEKARPLFERGLELYLKWEDLWGVALSIFHLGILESSLQHNDVAEILFEQSYEQFQSLGDIFFMGRVSLFLGYLHFDLDHQDLARRFFEEHLKIDSDLKFWNGMAEALRDLGKWHHHQGDLITAKDYEERCQSICQEHGLAPLIP